MVRGVVTLMLLLALGAGAGQSTSLSLDGGGDFCRCRLLTIQGGHGCRSACASWQRSAEVCLPEVVVGLVDDTVPAAVGSQVNGRANRIAPHTVVGCIHGEVAVVDHEGRIVAGLAQVARGDLETVERRAAEHQLVPAGVGLVRDRTRITGGGGKSACQQQKSCADRGGAKLERSTHDFTPGVPCTSGSLGCQS